LLARQPLQNQLERDPNSFVGLFFQTCFPTVDDWAFAVKGKKRNGSPATESCVELAKKSLAGQLDWKQVPLAAHMTANYQHYTGKTVAAAHATTADKEVLVVRMQHMWGDLKALDRQLGGAGNFGAVEGSVYTHGSESYSSSSKRISEAGVQLLCCALQKELEIYRDLMYAAANLHELVKRDTVQAAVERCGWKTWEGMTQACGMQTFGS
jgi:hypothetical protein